MAYSKTERKKRNTASSGYENRPLEPEKTYSVFERAFISQVWVLYHALYFAFLFTVF